MLYSYGEMYSVVDDMEFIVSKRLEMVHYVNNHGFKPAARHFRTDRQTIRKWYNRYILEGKTGLYDKSKKPKKSPHTIDQKTIDLITLAVKEAYEKNKYITVKNIRKKTKIKKYSDRTIIRYINKALDKKPKRKKKDKSTGGDVSFKSGLKPFEIIQIDIKYLTDIDNLRTYFKEDASKSLMRYQITARDVLTGFPLVAYCPEISVYYTTMFLQKVLTPFLAQFRYLDFKTIKIQTDNGIEFTNKYIRTGDGHEAKKTAFTVYINDVFKGHRTNIPGHCTQNSDVETFHWSIERDCLAWDDITDNASLIKCVNNYINTYVHTIIETRGYSPYKKIKETLHVRKVRVPKPTLLTTIDKQ